MKYVTAIFSGLFITVVVYMFIWFFARNFLDGLGVVIEVGGHAVVVLLAMVAGYSSFRASVAGK